MMKIKTQELMDILGNSFQVYGDVSVFVIILQAENQSYVFPIG